MNINFNLIFKSFIPFSIILLVVYLITTVIYFYLPKNNTLEVKEQNYIVEYKKYNISKSFQEKVIKKEVVKQTAKKEYKLISSIVLKAIYQKNNNRGWIIISEKKLSKTHILGIDDSFNNYRLKSIYSNYVIFVKGSKEYKLSLLKDNEVVKNIIKKKVKKEIIEDIKAVDDIVFVKRTFMDKYIKSPEKIWKEIAIKETKKDGKINGFKITRLSYKSVFYKLGLKQGDIIKSVNNIELKNYANAFKIYNDIGTLQNLSFTILRNNKEMELEYEIK